MTAPCAADGLMTRPSPGLRPPSPGGRGISAKVSARHRLIESLLPPGEGARSADEGRVSGSVNEMGLGGRAAREANIQASRPPHSSLTLGATASRDRPATSTSPKGYGLRAVSPESTSRLVDKRAVS